MGKKKLFVLVFGITLLVGGGVVFALSSSDFSAKANIWVNNNCNNPSTAGNQKSLFCYLWHKSNEQQTTLNTQQGQINSQTTINDTQQTQITNVQNKVATLEAKNTPELLEIFPLGSLSHLQESSVIQKSGRSFMYLDAVWTSGQGGFNLSYSDDGTTWTYFDALAGTANTPNTRVKLIPLSHEQYKVTIINSFSGKLTGFKY